MYYKFDKKYSDEIERLVNAGYPFPANAYTTKYADVIREFTEFDYLLKDVITEQYEEKINYICVVDNLPLPNDIDEIDEQH